MWTNESLKKVIRENFQGYKFIIVSNREPFLHTYDPKGRVVFDRSVGGVSITLDSIMRATKGTWVAYGGSAADKDTVDKDDHVRVPPDNPQYTLRRVWMSEQERLGYYEGFSNQTLWPLCHVVFKRPTFLEKDWTAYKQVNKRFAQAVLEEAGDKKCIVWIHDYQLALVAKYIKEKRPDIIVAHFWHIPWPTHEIFRICPWKSELINGLLNNDLLGFHRYYHMDNFMNTVSREIECKVDNEDSVINFKGHKTKIGFFPISVDYHEITKHLAELKDDRTIVEKYVKFDYQILALGIDRIDYTKGIINRFLAIERFLELYPKYKRKFVYLGFGARSRSGINSYRELEDKIRSEVDRINARFSKDSWQPIVFVNEVIKREEALQISRVAHMCLVTPLDDGMNLVAKEFVAANNGEGSLVLSSFAGAAKELSDAYLINPYDIVGTAKRMNEAIEASEEVRKNSMKKMKTVVEYNNVFRWASKFLLQLAKTKTS